MITGDLWKLYDDDALRRIDSASVRLLTESGARIEHDGLLDRLEAAGCRIERSGMRCYFPEKLIRDAIAHFAGRPGDSVEIPVGWNPQRHLVHGGSFPHLVEWPSGRRRLATRQDVIDMARMAHVLEEFGALGRVLVCSEVNPVIEPLWTTLQLAQTTDKPIVGGEVLLVDQVEPLVRMGEVITDRTGDTSMLVPCDFFISPLILDTRQADLFLAKRGFGMPTMPGTMTISGMSGPVTVAGTVAIAVAELVAGWVMGYVVSPDLAATGLVCTGSLDMRTASVCFSSTEALLQDATTVQLCRRLYGMPVRAVTSYADCKHPGLQATFDKMFSIIGAPFGLSARIGSNGLLSAGMAYSPVQHLLDAEMDTALDRFWGTCEVNDETIAIDLIQEQIGTGSPGFTDTAHTLAHFRAENWYPKWLDRRPWQGEAAEARSEQDMLGRIDSYYRDAIRRYEPPEIDRAKIAELRRVFLSAERKMLGANVSGV